MPKSSKSIPVERLESIDFYPFAYALYNENLTKYCWYCLNENITHKRCTGCHLAIFCNRECQLLGWKDHRFECKALLKNIQTTIPDIEVRLLGRIVYRYKSILCGKDNEENFYKDRTSRRNIMDIWAHTKGIRNDQYAMNKFNNIYEKLIKFYDVKALLPKEIIFELHCRDFINRHAISDKAYLNEIGKGLYLDLCAYDHSCKPNTIYICNGFIATLRPLNSTVNLLDRSTTFYSYIDLLGAKQARRKLLKDTWYFQCECERCEDNFEHILTSMYCPNCLTKPPFRLCLFGNHSYKDCVTQLITCPECENPLGQEEVMQALGTMRFIEDILEKNNFNEMGTQNSINFLEDLLQRFENLLPKVNIYYCKLIQALIPLLNSKSQLKLLMLHKDVEECLRICYPQNHPAMGFHLRNIGIFSKNIGNLLEAQKYLQESLEIFTFVLKTNHSMTKTTKEALDDVEAEIIRQAVEPITVTEIVEQKKILTSEIKVLTPEINDTTKIKPAESEINITNKKFVELEERKINSAESETDKKFVELEKTKMEFGKTKIKSIETKIKSAELKIPGETNQKPEKAKNKSVELEKTNKNYEKAEIQNATKNKSSVESETTKIKSKKIEFDSLGNLTPKLNETTSKEVFKKNSNQTTFPEIKILEDAESSSENITTVNNSIAKLALPFLKPQPEAFNNSLNVELKIDTELIGNSPKTTSNTSTNSKSNSPLHSNESGAIGVKKKASMKKISPRARTPLPSHNVVALNHDIDVYNEEMRENNEKEEKLLNLNLPKFLNKNSFKINNTIEDTLIFDFNKHPVENIQIIEPTASIINSSKSQSETLNEHQNFINNPINDINQSETISFPNIINIMPSTNHIGEEQICTTIVNDIAILSTNNNINEEEEEIIGQNTTQNTNKKKR